MIERNAGLVVVIVAVIERHGRFLLGRRSAHKPTAPGYWCPVSGRVEPGETQAEAVVREVREETGLDARAVEYLEACPTRDGSAVLHFWRTEIASDARARIANDEHSELGWFSLEELRTLQPTFPEDVAILERAASGAGASER